MKKTKMILGIVSMVLCMIILLQSCAAGISNTLSGNGELGGSAGVILGLFMVIGGIIAIVTHNSGKIGSFVASGFYIFGSLIGYFNAGSYLDLIVWSTVSLIFGIFFIVAGILNKKNTEV